jgi:hypothetical protein
MNGKKWIRTWFIIIIIIPIVGGFNYVVDPYGYNNLLNIERFNSNKLGNTSMTTRFKANILSNGNFNAIMLGTSRIGVMNPNIVNKYLNTNTFNLEYPGSNTDIQNKFFKYAFFYNKDIKYLIYGIDFMSFNKNRTTKNDFKEFYDLENKIDSFEQISNTDFYFNLHTFFKSSKLVIKNILGKYKTEPKYLISNGMRDYINHIEELNKGTFDIDKNIKQSIKGYFRANTGMYKNYTFSYDFLNSFKNTLEFCKKNDIKVFVYIPPMYSDHFDAISKAGYFKQFELFKRELVNITDFIDFTGHNQISTNKDNYWDSSHLRKELTQVIMAKLFNDKTINIPKDFGKLVTKDNIEEHLQKLRLDIKDYDLKSVLK